MTNAASAALWNAMGTELTLTPVPADGYRFYGWEGDVDGLTVGADGSIAFSVGGPMSLTCLFADAGSSGTVRRLDGFRR